MIYDFRFARGGRRATMSFMNREKLKARTKSFALRVMTMVDALPRTAKGRVLTDQVLRSGTAVASGYRAACRARSRADWIDKIGRALEEADETLLWLEVIEEGGLLPARRLARLMQEASELTAIFASAHISSKLTRPRPNS
jgi:four helix bundle protein